MNLPRVLIGATLSSLFDPDPVDFRAADEVGVLPVRRACTAVSGALQPLRPVLNRNAFLVGCLDLTEDARIEHLIIGFGTRHGSTTKVSALMHAIGNANSVAPTPAMQQAVQNHLRESFKGEVIVFHNHPKNWLNQIFDNSPLASGQDRTVMLRHLLVPQMLLRFLLDGGRVLFYLGENGFVRRFHTPELLDALERLGNQRQQAEAQSGRT